MADQVSIRKTSTAHSKATYKGTLGEVSVDVDTQRVTSYDGATSGGFPHALVSDLPDAAPAAEAASFAVSSGQIGYHVDPTTAPVTGTMPSAPAKWEVHWFVDSTGQCGTHAITLNGDGYNILGQATLVLNIAFAFIKLQFNGTQWVQIP